MEAFIIRRGGFSGRIKYWAGFKGDGEGGKPRSEWVRVPNEAVRFAREIDAKRIILGLRLIKLSPCAVRLRVHESGPGPDAGQPQP